MLVFLQVTNSKHKLGRFGSIGQPLVFPYHYYALQSKRKHNEVSIIAWKKQENLISRATLMSDTK